MKMYNHVTETTIAILPISDYMIERYGEQIAIKRCIRRFESSGYKNFPKITYASVGSINGIWHYRTA